ncbi:TylF/MycF/NovP-related O-methyltransferase, partial [Oceanispirochaeta sp. M1]|uniref:TylF/MycF/NovP-related O-methyltransferase n=3 Tax=unclassified Oceanispirochaeta TaxID=2635722 RepID=UPI0011C0837C
LMDMNRDIKKLNSFQKEALFKKTIVIDNLTDLNSNVKELIKVKDDFVQEKSIVADHLQDLNKTLIAFKPFNDSTLTQNEIIIDKFYTLNKDLNSLLTVNNKKLNQINTNLINVESTPNIFWRKRINLAVDDSFSYIKKFMSSAIFIGGDRTMFLRKALEQVSISGEYIEFGVYSGTTINQIADLNPKKIIYGFDSFKGLPEDWSSGHVSVGNQDFFEKGSFEIEIPKVKSNVELIIGWFSDSLPKWKIKNINEIAFIFIDCDLYSSTKTVLFQLEARIVKGTIIVFDEYFGYFEWENGEFKAFQEFVIKFNIEYTYLFYRYDQVAVRIEKKD